MPGYASLDKVFVDVAFERAWRVNDRVRVLGFAGPTAAHFDSSEEYLDEGGVLGLNAGVAFEIRLGRRLLLRPEIRHRFLATNHVALRDSDIGSVGFGIRF
ncbi:MAG TPA: hypothetical protein VGV61_10820 [Thermoanaerobaculia bacterium]|nr:hypothetical protein [Thermoanaerobaculia bacterium]